MANGKKNLMSEFTFSAFRYCLPCPLDRAGLGQNTLTLEVLALVVRSEEGLLHRTRNLCLGAIIETVRGQADLAR